MDVGLAKLSCGRRGERGTPSHIQGWRSRESKPCHCHHGLPSLTPSRLCLLSRNKEPRGKKGAAPPSQLPSPLATATFADHPCAATQAEPRPGESASHCHRWRRRSAHGEGEATAVAGTPNPRRRRARRNLCRRQSNLLCRRAIEEKTVQSHRTGETERSAAEPGFSHLVHPRLRRRCRLDRNYRRQKGVSGRRGCRCRRRELHLCDSDRQGWSCDFRDCCRSSGLSFCHLRPCCRRRKTLPAPLPESGRRYYLRWLPGCCGTSSEIAAVSVQPFLWFESLWLLRKRFGVVV
ncbi:uncharacterized protein [Arachis hypogaea]|uniref:uncharacterized protein n=1 Tax=Arachis hypogaea TaxID=3818 RepID=UPI003B210B35